MRLITSSRFIIWRLLVSVLVLSLILSHTSGASSLGNIRKLVVAPGPAEDSLKVVLLTFFS